MHVHPVGAQRQPPAQDPDRARTTLQFPGTNYRIIDARNWLSLEFDERERIWANWHVEGEQQVVTKVVHPCERTVVATS